MTRAEALGHATALTFSAAVLLIHFNHGDVMVERAFALAALATYLLTIFVWIRRS